MLTRDFRNIDHPDFPHDYAQNLLGESAPWPSNNDNEDEDSSGPGTLPATQPSLPPGDTPSLGIIFFPQRAFSVVPDHTYYLPLVASTWYTKDTPGSVDSVRSSAESNWKDLGVRCDRLLFDLPASPVVEMETAMEYEPKVVSAAFKKLLPTLEPVEDQRMLCVERNSRWGYFIARTYLSEPLVIQIL